MSKAKTAAKPAAKTPPKPSAPAVIKSAGKSVAQMPDFMKSDKLRGKGIESLDASDFSAPRIKLIQSNSPEITTFENARPGVFWHAAAGMPLGREFRAVVLYVSKGHILWRPRDDGGGILARADDGIHWSPPSGEFKVKLKNKKTVTWKLAPTVKESGLDAWGSSDPDDPASQPASTYIINFALALPDFPELTPSLFSSQRSSIKPARGLLTMFRGMTGPTFGMYLNIKSVDDKNNNNQPFKNVRFEPAGYVADKNEFSNYTKLYDMFAKYGVKTRDLPDHDEEEDIGGGAPAPAGDEAF